MRLSSFHVELPWRIKTSLSCWLRVLSGGSGGVTRSPGFDIGVLILALIRLRSGIAACPEVGGSICTRRAH